jgi:hypothetical protein
MKGVIKLKSLARAGIMKINKFLDGVDTAHVTKFHVCLSS